MKVQDLSVYYHQPCKFRLRSGKEVFGVIWPENAAFENALNFASSADYRAMSQQAAGRRGFRLGHQEIIGVQRL